MNGDGYDDLIISTIESDPNSYTNAGTTYILFGSSASSPGVVDLSDLSGGNGFRIDGTSAYDYAGYSVSSAGDVNNDGFDDLIVGVPGAASGAGKAYVIFGSTSLGSGGSFELSTITGMSGTEGGLLFAGTYSGDNADWSVDTAGDVNGDGFADFIIGAPHADYNGTSAGEAYLLFGGDFTSSVTHTGTASDNTLTGTSNGDVMTGKQGNDTLLGEGNNSQKEVLRGGQGDDILEVTGTADLVFGGTSSLYGSRIDGGNGNDRLRIDGSGVTVNLTTIPKNRITGIEEIDITGSGNNTLTLTVAEVLNLSDHSNRLIVMGNSGDTLNKGGGWTSAGTEVVDSVKYNKFTQDNAVLLVSQSLVSAEAGFNPAGVGEYDPVDVGLATLLLDEAIARWAGIGVDVDSLSGVQVEVVDFGDSPTLATISVGSSWTTTRPAGAGSSTPRLAMTVSLPSAPAERRCARSRGVRSTTSIC